MAAGGLLQQCRLLACEQRAGWWGCLPARTKNPRRRSMTCTDSVPLALKSGESSASPAHLLSHACLRAVSWTAGSVGAEGAAGSSCAASTAASAGRSAAPGGLVCTSSRNSCAGAGSSRARAWSHKSKEVRGPPSPPLWLSPHYSFAAVEQVSTSHVHRQMAQQAHCGAGRVAGRAWGMERERAGERKHRRVGRVGGEEWGEGGEGEPGPACSSLVAPWRISGLESLSRPSRPGSRRGR